MIIQLSWISSASVQTSYGHETKFYSRDKKRCGIVVIHIYLLIFKYRSINKY